jgi:16S rRNA (cytidine1402-2'-O)-methyltransferase
MAIMSSGMNGQSFAYNGYLPIDKSDKKRAIKTFERLSLEYNQSQLFIETPYRNNKLVEDLLQNLSNDTLLCIATDISLSTEFIKTKSVSQWKFEIPDLHKRPTIFIIHKK